MTNSNSVVYTKLTDNLERLLGKSVDVRINQNRKTMLSILSKSENHVRVSIHEIFLYAPKEVVEAAARFIQSQEKQPLKVLQFYIHEQFEKRSSDAEACLKEPVETLGRFYNLEKEWGIVNQQYFKSSVNVHLTWFGSYNQKNRSRVTLGLYDKKQNLIKVHRLLDTPQTPRYYLQFLLYHEALHKLYPPYLDEDGTYKIHHETFKKHEKRFREYSLARNFEQSCKKNWFAL